MTGRAGRPRWRYRLSLRLRITLLTAAVVAVVVALGGFLILVALRAALVSAADEAVQVRAQEMAALAVRDELPRPVPAMHDPVTFAEVVADGRTVTASEGLVRGTGEGTGFDLPEERAGKVDLYGVSRLPLGGSGPYRVAARGVTTPTGPMTVFVAVSVANLEHTMGLATRIGAIGTSLLVLVLATVTWLAIGRTLAPVDAIRARADAITGQNLDQRVPVPAQRDEIGRLARTVNQMLGRLQHSAEKQRRFVADAAHELRSPIASLRVQLETARDGDGSRRRESDMLHETARMEGLVNQLLVLARADADGPWLRLATVDLDDIIDSAVGALGSVGPVSVDTSAVEPVQLCGDADLLEQVVRNLVHNALRHARGAVRISASAEPGDLAVLTVDDDGPGVPESRREEIFGRFVRLEDSRDRDRGGVGLGLAIVAEIANAHGGHISVSDSPSGGARFVVELPIGGPTHTGQSTPGIR